MDFRCSFTMTSLLSNLWHLSCAQAVALHASVGTGARDQPDMSLGKHRQLCRQLPVSQDWNSRWKKVTYVTSQSLEIPTLYMHHTGEWWQWKGILQNFVIKETNYQSWSKGNSYPFQNGPSTWSKAMTEKMILEKLSGRILWTWTFHCSYLH